MIGGSIRYTRKNVLTQFSEKDVFNLAGIPYQEGFLLNPFRKDSNPKCAFNFYNNILWFCDGSGFFGNTNCIDCIKAVGYATGLKGKELYEYIYKNAVHTTGQKQLIQRQPISIRIKVREWENNDFFIKHGFKAEDLKKELIYPVKSYQVTTKKSSELKTNPFGDPKYFPVYAYCYPSGRIKLYWPYNKENKFYTNTLSDDINGKYFVGEKIWITKSAKDYMFLKYMCGYDVIATQTENIILPNIKGFYTEIIYLYDNDPAGIKASMKIREQGYSTRTILPSKDPFDLYLEYGMDYAKNYFKWLNT